MHRYYEIYFKVYKIHSYSIYMYVNMYSDYFISSSTNNRLLLGDLICNLIYKSFSYSLYPQSHIQNKRYDVPKE